MATIPSRTSFAWFRASLCNANQVSTCGCWPRKLEVRQLENKLKTHKKKTCLLKESAMNVVGLMLEPLHDKRASQAVRRNINKVSRCPLVFCIDTCLPHILDHFISFRKRWVFRHESALKPAETKGARTRGGNVTSSQLRQASGSCPEPRTSRSSWFVHHGWGWNSKWVATYHKHIIRKENVFRILAFSVFTYDSVIATDLYRGPWFCKYHP